MASSAALARWRPLAGEAVDRLRCAAGAPALARRRNRGRLTILMFHGVEPKPLTPACWHVTDSDTLRRQLDYVRRHFTVLPLAAALDQMQSGRLPDNAATLTFDDGTRNLLTHASPILRDLRLPAAVFLATGPMGTPTTLWPDRLWLAFARTTATQVDLGPIGLGVMPLSSTADRETSYASAVHRFKDLPDAQRLERLNDLVTALGQSGHTDPGPFQLLSWDEAEALADDGLISLHPHTATHPILSRCHDDKVDIEITESCAAVGHAVGSPPRIFAYPNGRAQDFDDRAKSALRRCGVRWALSTSYGFADAGDDPLALPRVPIGSDLSWPAFKLLVSGHPLG
jgi:peptidoglycan/xylan/chitin deacetylase (PgdA/CDA1 family)